MKQQIQAIAAENRVSVNTQTLLLLAEQLGRIAALAESTPGAQPVHKVESNVSERVRQRFFGEPPDASVLMRLRELAKSDPRCNQRGERECWFFDGLPKDLAGENPTRLLLWLRDAGILKAERGRLNTKRPHPQLIGVCSAMKRKVRCVVLDYDRLMEMTNSKEG